jgi:inhibitor of KinA
VNRGPGFHPPHVKCIPYGPNAWLLYFSDEVGDAAYERGRAIAHELESNPPEGLREYVLAYTSVLLIFGEPNVKHHHRPIEQVVAQLEKVAKRKLKAAPIKEIPVRYDGEDLERVASHTGLSKEEVMRLHSGTIYKVYMLGFAPGFPYLGELDARLHTPRLESPRPTVPAGSVAIGGEHTGVYSIPNPGGWNLIGSTDVKLFEPDPPAEETEFYLQAGDRVRFVVN